MAVSVKDNTQSTNFSSYIVISDLQDDGTENDLLTGGAGSVNVVIIENEGSTDTDAPSIGSSGTAQEMKLRSYNSASVARITTCFIKDGHAFTNLSVSGSNQADATVNPPHVTNVIILGS